MLCLLAACVIFSDEAGTLAYPVGVAAAADRVLIVDRKPPALVERTATGVRERASSPELIAPRSIAVAPDGTIYVTDTGRRAILTVDADGAVTPFADSLIPTAIVADDRTVWVADAGRHSLTALDRTTGRPIWSVAAAGVRGLTVREQTLHAVTSEGVVRTYDGNGKATQLFVDRGLAYPAGLAIVDGRFFVTDSYAKTVIEFDRDGTRVAAHTAEAMIYPVGISATADKALLIADPKARQIVAIPLDAP